MKLRALGLRTDALLHRFFGEVIDRGDYLVVRTPSRPNYYWGNCLIMSRPPEAGEFERWLARFEREIGPRQERGFVAIAWDGTDGEAGGVEPFLQDGFQLQRSKILTAQAVHAPPKFDEEMTVRPISSDRDWEQLIEVHFQPDWEYGGDAAQRQFIADGRDAFRRLVADGHATRFGVEIGGSLVGDAGLYWDSELGRFNNVSTHRDFRRRGVCSSLIYRMARFAIAELGLETLVMEADEDYHAAAIYEAIGFAPVERLVQLEWRLRR